MEDTTPPSQKGARLQNTQRGFLRRRLKTLLRFGVEGASQKREKIRKNAAAKNTAMRRLPCSH
jgi:hypothetical protein